MLINGTIHLRIAVTILLLLLTACSELATIQPEAQTVIVTRDNPTLPEGCTPTEVAQLITHFLDAFNRGDQETLADLFALAGGRWFAANRGDGEEPFTAYTQASLLHYFADRHQHNERLQLLKVNVSPRGLRGADITFQLTREADDVKPGTNGRKRYVGGKGAIFCRTQKFMVWGMGTKPPDFSKADLSRVCPDPPTGAPENAVVACARPVPEEEG